MIPEEETATASDHSLSKETEYELRELIQTGQLAKALHLVRALKQTVSGELSPVI